MPTVILNDDDILKALRYLTNDNFEMNRITRKVILPNGDLEIRWTYKKYKKYGVD